MTDFTRVKNEFLNYLYQDRNFVILLLFSSLFIRLLFILLFQSENTIPSTGDARAFDSFALNILEGSGWWIERPISNRPPGYPLFLSLIYTLFGHNYVVVRVVQAVLSSMAVLLTFFLAREIFGRKVAILASLWSTIHFHFIYYSAQIIRETLVTFLILLLIFALNRLYKKIGLSFLFISGLVYTFLVHTDPRYLFYIPFFLIWMFFSFEKKKKALDIFSIFLLIVIVMMVPWTIRNYVVYNKLVIITPRTLERKIPILSDFFSSLPRGHALYKDIETNEKDKAEKNKNLLEVSLNVFNSLKNSYWEFRNFWRVYSFRDREDPFLNRWEEINLSSTPARYIRFYVDSFYGVGGGINEIEVYSREKGDRNVALNKSVKASNFYDDNFTPGKVVDGIVREENWSGYWILPNKTTGWVQVDLLSQYYLKKVRWLNTHDSQNYDRATAKWRIEISLDGTNFSKVGEGVKSFFNYREAIGEGKYRFLYTGKWSLKHNIASTLSFGLLLPFFIFGTIILLKKRNRDSYILLLPVVTQTVLHMLQWGQSRYRVPVEPYVIILFSFGVTYFFEMLKEKWNLVPR